MSLTATDFFCGMGGSSTGLVRAGIEVKIAANHWDRAIETHAANHPDTEHLQGDLQAIDVRYLPRTDILWASPICTELSPAGGHRKKGSQLDLFEDHGHVPTAAFERTRVTFWEVVRAAEVHRYPIILIENVVESARWELFDVWLAAMTTLGYDTQFASVSAAHIGDGWNPHAPQWRDRLYIVFRRTGVRALDVSPKPLAYCWHCGQDIRAEQWWKRPGRGIGKYGAQYIYVCPEGGHGQVEPYTRPASAVIDWTNLGTRLGDRARLPGASTMRRIQTGLDMWRRGDFDRGFVLSTNHGGTDGRHFDPHTRPMPTQTVKRGEALVVAAAEPHRSQRASGTDFLVIPYRKGSAPSAAGHSPLTAQTARSQHSLCRPAVDILDCHFRMLTPREAANAQAFPTDYIIRGNQGEQQMQAGNAVAVNVAAWLGQAATRALDTR